MSERVGEPPKNNDYWVGYLSYTIGAFVNGDIDREGLEEMYREFMADATISPELRATLPPAPHVRPPVPPSQFTTPGLSRRRHRVANKTLGDALVGGGPSLLSGARSIEARMSGLSSRGRFFWPGIGRPPPQVLFPPQVRIAADSVVPLSIADTGRDIRRFARDWRRSWRGERAGVPGVVNRSTRTSPGISTTETTGAAISARPRRCNRSTSRPRRVSRQW